MQIRKISFIVLLVFLWSGLCAQITPKGQYSVANSTTNFDINISVGNTVYNVGNGKYYMCISGALSSETLTSAPLKFKEIPTGSCLSSFSETDPVVKAISGIIKSNGTTISAAVSGTDFAPAHSHPYEASGAVATHAALTTTAHGLGASAFHPDAYFATAHAHPYEAANVNIQSHITSAHQAVISGTGFVKAVGTTISYDNSSYSLTSHNHSGVYLTSYTETDPTISAWAKSGTKPTYTYSEVGAASTSDSRLSDARVASDVYSWAKAAVKPGYSYSEVGAAPSSTVSFPGFGTTGTTAANGNHNHSGVYLTSFTETDPTISAWAKSGTKPTYTYSEVGAQPLTTNLTSLGGLTNAAGWLKNNGSGTFAYSTPSYSDVGAAAAGHNHNSTYLTSFTETDPTVSAWAKATSKPSYSFSEVGAAPSSTVSFPGFGTTHALAAYGDHNHSGVYLTSFTETDPTISSWAKAASKPGYSYSEVGAAPSGTVSFPGFGTTHALSAYGDHTHSYLSSETDPTIYAWAKAAAKPGYSYSEVGAAPSGTVSFPGFGSTGTTACVGNDSRLSDSRIASDVSAWAKAGTKPGYSYSEVGAAPSGTVSFPGFGTTHALSAYGDHTHSYLSAETDPSVYAWAKASTKPSYSYSEVGAAPSGTVSFPGFGTTVSMAANGNHTHAGVYLTSYSETDPNVSAWAKAASKPSYAWSEISSKPTNLSSFTNDLGNYGGWITGFTETDPTIYAWAKAAAKPSYSWSEVTSKPTALSGFSNDLGNYGGWITGSGNTSGSSGSCSGNSATATNFNNGSAYSSGGTVTAVTFTETSARKYKHDIAPMSPQLLNIMKLNPVDYMLNLTGKKDKGFIADEIIQVYPEFADSTGVNYSKIVSVLVKGMQEQQVQIEQLKQEIELLKSK